MANDIECELCYVLARVLFDGADQVVETMEIVTIGGQQNIMHFEPCFVGWAALEYLQYNKSDIFGQIDVRTQLVANGCSRHADVVWQWGTLLPLQLIRVAG